MYRGLGQLDDAVAAFRKALELEPTFIHFRNLGMVLAEDGKYSEAAEALNRSIEMRPNQYRAWGLLASVYLNQHADAAKVRDTYLKAITLAADLLKETPKDEYLLADVGGYYAALGKEKEGLPLLAQAAALAPDIPEVLYEVAVGTKCFITATGAAVACESQSWWLSFGSDRAKSAAGRASRGPAERVDRGRPA